MQYSFEESYARLETILKTLSSGEAPLEESLKLYEEADSLIKTCNARLTSAEQKIEMMIKNREGHVELENFK